MSSLFLRSIRHRGWLAVYALLSIVTVSVLPAASPTHMHKSKSEIERVWALWHDAGVAESHQQQDSAITIYEHIARESMVLSTPVREWYLANAEYGIAVARSSGSDRNAARLALSRAVKHHFEAWGAIRSLPSLVQLVGDPWLDSLETRSQDVELRSQHAWEQQPTVILHPRLSHGTPTIIVAFHGGNACYLDFAAHWQAVADRFNAIVVVPPGTHRVGPYTNSWDNDFSAIRDEVLPLIDSIARSGIADATHIVAAGYSQGAQVATYFGLMYPDRVQGVLCISGYVPQLFADSIAHHSAMRGLRFAAISGKLEQPAMLGGMTALTVSLRDAGIPSRFNIIDGMPHEVPLDLANRIESSWNWLNQPYRTTSATLSE